LTIRQGTTTQCFVQDTN